MPTVHPCVIVIHRLDEDQHVVAVRGVPVQLPERHRQMPARVTASAVKVQLGVEREGEGRAS
jgi:hypothetical protein